MPYDDKKRDYTIKYAKEKLKRIPLDVTKQYYDEILKPVADSVGMSVNGFIKEAIQEKITREARKATE